MTLYLSVRRLTWNTRNKTSRDVYLKIHNKSVHWNGRTVKTKGNSSNLTSSQVTRPLKNALNPVNDYLSQIDLTMSFVFFIVRIYPLCEPKRRWISLYVPKCQSHWLMWAKNGAVGSFLQCTCLLIVLRTAMEWLIGQWENTWALSYRLH